METAPRHRPFTQKISLFVIVGVAIISLAICIRDTFFRKDHPYMEPNPKEETVDETLVRQADSAIKLMDSLLEKHEERTRP